MITQIIWKQFFCVTDWQIIWESRMRGFQEGGFQIVERTAFSSRGYLLLQGNSCLKSTLRLLLRRRVRGQICYLRITPSDTKSLRK